MSPEPTLSDYRWVLLTLLSTIFICWLLQEILERCCRMSPNITPSSSISHISINRKMTKSLDIRGRFRIQTRGTVYFIKALHQFILFISSISIFILYPNWFLNHFVNLQESSVYFLPYLHISSSLVGYYGWEVCSNRYGKLTYPVLIHHWFTVGIAMSILFGCYTPFATWYGFTTISMSFPVFIILGIRAQYANKYPSITRKLFIFAFYYFGLVLILNLFGQSIIIYFFYIDTNKSISILLIIIMFICIGGWLYDDIKILNALYSFSTDKYEEADILNSPQLIPLLGISDNMNISIPSSMPPMISLQQIGVSRRKRFSRMN